MRRFSYLTNTNNENIKIDFYAGFLRIWGKMQKITKI